MVRVTRHLGRRSRDDACDMTIALGAAPPPPQDDWAYFLDVDGTLIEIAARPESVCVPGSLITLLGDLYRRTGGACALVSGRQINDLDALFAPLRLPAAGVHGAEWRQDGGAIERLGALGENAAGSGGLAAELAEAREALRPLASAHPLISVEDKGTALAVHFRSSPDLAGMVRSAAAAIVASGTLLQAQHGKMVVELKPAGVNKGQAVLRYLDVAPFQGRRPVYVGDDLTDEYGFEVANRSDGIAVRVGDGAPTCAPWHLPSVGAVHQWLARRTAETDMTMNHDHA